MSVTQIWTSVVWQIRKVNPPLIRLDLFSFHMVSQGLLTITLSAITFNKSYTENTYSNI